MKRIKSCSTLRLKAHQLLNEEEREIFKYAIRNYRKNQSVDTLCEIISKIITDSNRSCLVSLIADMLKEEQRSQFLHKCYTRLPGYNLSQNHLAGSEVQVNKDFHSNNLSLRAATFVSKNRVNQSKSNYQLNKSTTFDEGGSTLKINKDNRKKISDPKRQNNNLTHSDSEELLKTIERCSRKERPTLSNLKDKGFWYCNNDSATDDDSTRSYSSLLEKDQPNTIVSPVVNFNEVSKFYSGVRNSKTTIFNGNERKSMRFNDVGPKPKDSTKLMVCKLHFSSVNILEEFPENVDHLSVSTHSTTVSLFHSNSFDNIFVEYHLPLFSEIFPSIYTMPSIFQPKPVESTTVVHNSFRTKNNNHIVDHNMKKSVKVELETKIKKSKDIYIDQECQTPFVKSCDSSTQTFLA